MDTNKLLEALNMVSQERQFRLKATPQAAPSDNLDKMIKRAILQDSIRLLDDLFHAIHIGE